MLGGIVNWSFTKTNRSLCLVGIKIVIFLVSDPMGSLTYKEETHHP